jgi:DNA polymerase-3 subunit beta
MFEISLQREKLLGPLQMVANIVEKRQTLPILSHILIRGQNDLLTFIGSDVEMEVHSMITLDHSNYNGIEFTIPGKKFLDICRSVAENSTIKITVNEGKANVSCGHSRFVMPSFPPRDFPLASIQNREIEVTVPSIDLAKLINKTSFAIPQQDVRKYLNGLLFEIKDSKLMALATDGHRLAMHKVSCASTKNSFAQVIIPKKAIFTLNKMLTSTSQDITLGFNENFITIAGDNCILISKLISGKFPNYSKIIPSKGDLELTLNCADIKQALIRVNILSSELFRSVQFTIGKGVLTLDANNPEQEEAVEEIMVDYQKPEVAMTFNISYFLDILNVIEDDHEAKIFFNDGGGSVVIEEAGNGPDCFYVLMPIRH